MKIISTNDSERQRWNTVLYKSPPLTGKTHCVGSWTKLGPQLYIQWDPKSETIDLFPDVYKIAPASPKEFEQVILPQIMAGKLEYEGKLIDYQSVAVDSLSFYARELELEIMGTNDDMPGGGWQHFANRLGRVLGRLGSLARNPNHPHPAHFLATVHEQEKQRSIRSQGQNVAVSDGMLPQISGRLRNALEGYFDLVLLPTKQSVAGTPQPGKPRTTTQVYICRTVGTEKGQAAGGRFMGKVLPPEVDGTYEGLVEAVKGA